MSIYNSIYNSVPYSSYNYPIYNNYTGSNLHLRQFLEMIGGTFIRTDYRQLPTGNYNYNYAYGFSYSPIEVYPMTMVQETAEISIPMRNLETYMNYLNAKSHPTDLTFQLTKTKEHLYETDEYFKELWDTVCTYLYLKSE